MDRRKSALPIGDLLADYLRESGLEQPLLEQRLMMLWPEVVGKPAATLTAGLEVKNGVLYARLRSAALKAELFQCRFEVVGKLNEAVGAKIIRDIRFLG